MPEILVFGAAIGAHTLLIASFHLMQQLEGAKTTLAAPLVTFVLVMFMTIAVGITFWVTRSARQPRIREINLSERHAPSDTFDELQTDA